MLLSKLIQNDESALLDYRSKFLSSISGRRYIYLLMIDLLLCHLFYK